jgi:hypothetical protein
MEPPYGGIAASDDVEYALDVQLNPGVIREAQLRYQNKSTSPFESRREGARLSMVAFSLLDAATTQI